MALRINPARVPVWRDPHTLQLGLGSEAVLLSDVQAPQERLINLLFRGIPSDSLGLLGRSVGVEDSEVESLMSRLKPAMLDSAVVVPESQLSQDFVRQAFAEIIRASFQHNVDGVAVLSKRGQQSVAIPRLNRVTLAVAFGLAESGVGRLICTDYEPVGLEDLGSLGFDQKFLGSPRALALAEMTSRNRQPLEVATEASRAGFDLLLACAAHPLSQADLDDFVALCQQDAAPRPRARVARRPAAAIAIELGIEQSSVSPVMIRGTTPCLDCRNRWRDENDSSWAAIAAQLRNRRLRLDDAQTSLLTAALSLERILGYLDRGLDSKFEASRIDHRTGMVLSETWSPNEECPCQ